MVAVNPVYRILPDGSHGWVHPFHLSFEGLEKMIICRDDEDCDMLVKCIFLCARKAGVLVIIYAVVSNHAHVALLALNHAIAKGFGNEVKRRYSQYFQKKYNEIKVLKGADVNIQAIDSMYYLRNVLAYVPKNAYDNGARSLSEYKWTGFRAFFRKGEPAERLVSVKDMPRRDWRDIFRTGDSLKDVPWKVNLQGELDPASCCDIEYLEKAFNNDETFFLGKVGNVNVAEMNQKLVESPRKMKTDAEFIKEVEELALRWFGIPLKDMSISQKSRLIPYVFHTNKTTVKQLARCFGLECSHISRLLNLDKVER